MKRNGEGGFVSTLSRLLVVTGVASLYLGDAGVVQPCRAADAPATPAPDAVAPSTSSLPAAVTDSTEAMPHEFSVIPAGGRPFLTNFVYAPSSNHLGATIQFAIAGGTSNQIYDILTTTNATALNVINSSWNWLGQGAAGSSHVFYHQPTAAAFYTVAPPRGGFVAAWGDDSYGESDVPPGLSNVVAVAGGYTFSLALRSDGTLAAWGDGSWGETNIPPGLSNVVAIAAGPYHSLALRADGTVTNWGKWWDDTAIPLPMMLPAGLSNVVGIAAGAEHDIALRANGSVVVWGYTNELYNTVPSGLGGVIAVTAGWDHNVALFAGGTVDAWGYNNIGLTTGLITPPPDLTNCTAISAWALHTLAVRFDGTVEAWGDDLNGQTNVPSGLSNVVAVATSEAISLALKRDGTLAMWGDFSQPTPPFMPQGLTNVTAIGAGGNHALAICTGLSTPVILQEPQSQILPSGQSATFTALGQAASSVSYQWQFNGLNIVGATNSVLTLTNVQSANNGSYQVVVSGASGSLTSSNATFTVLSVPTIQSLSPSAGTTNLVTNQLTLAVNATAPASAQFPLSYQWLQNGMAISHATSSALIITPNYTAAWQTNPIDGVYSVQVGNAEGIVQSGPVTIRYLSIPPPGSVVAWGSNASGESDYPTNLTDAKSIAAGQSFSLALHDGGTIVAWGANNAGQCNVPSGLTNVTAIAAGDDFALALKSDGTVTGWGNDKAGQTDVPAGLSNVVAVAAGGALSIALLSNGRITNWGNVHSFTNPASLTNVTAIAAGEDFFLALRSNGTVTAWGSNAFGQLNVPAGLSNVVAIAAGGEHCLALKSDGTVSAWGDNSHGQCNIPIGLSNVLSVAAGSLHSVALQNNGTVVVWGDNSAGETNLPAGLVYDTLKRIAAGGGHTLALVFDPALEYDPLDVRQDMLLIYNTNSADSATVLNYYLANRPGVSNANVLGIGYTNWVLAPANTACGLTNSFYTNYLETISTTDLTNQILAPLQAWLAAHPTKRPQYVVLFLDVPSRVVEPVWDYFPTCGSYPCCNPSIPNHSSVQYYINSACLPGWNPFVTSINMNGTNDCIGYINKLKSFGANYAPGKLVISASAGGYGNTNYYLDDAHGIIPAGMNAQTALLNAGVPAADIDYDPLTNTVAITNGAGIAGYFSWATHGLFYPGFAVNGELQFGGNSGWFIMTTGESYNGRRYETDQSTFMSWFAATAFGGANYANTPVGALGTVDEPGLYGIAPPYLYCVSWAQGKNFAISAWRARGSPYFQAVGDPFVQR